MASEEGAAKRASEEQRIDQPKLQVSIHKCINKQRRDVECNSHKRLREEPHDRDRKESLPVGTNNSRSNRWALRIHFKLPIPFLLDFI